LLDYFAPHIKYFIGVISNEFTTIGVYRGTSIKR